MGKWLSAFWGRFRHRADHLSLTLALGLSALSVLCIYAIYVAGYCKDRPWQIQALATGLGFCAVVVMVGLFDYESLAGLWRFYYPLTAVVMIYTAFFGETRPGSDNRSWLDLGVTSIQPSEVWKLAFILTFAWHLAKVREDLNHPRVLIPVLLNAGVGVGVVLLQKDTGVALVLAAIVVAMLFVAGLSRKLILGAMGVGVVSVPVVWFRLLSDFQKERILSLFDPQQFVETTAMQQLEGLDSLGSGQVFGIGLFAENHNYVPEMYNDFIFTFIGESFGFVGCVAVVAALSIICGRMLWTGAVSRSYVGKYICTGIFAMLAFQIIVNIGMCLMVLPVIGITLPFLSYGGTSVLSAYLSLGLVMLVHGSNKKTMFEAN
ncbi:MAG: FtsW/RodA/SpoVE family cell cycle protein [Angelakisella sp.]|jgi:rod shape determining protein RodA|nr:FtsW/RodA/SpoVE family cell cycle protein [Angelakisella sp.]